MRRLTRASFLVLVLLALTACSSSPRDRLLLARSSLTAVEVSVIAAHDSGALSDESLLKIEGPIMAAQDALREAGEFLISHPDGGSGFEIAMATIDAIVVTIRRTLADEMEDG